MAKGIYYARTYTFGAPKDVHEFPEVYISSFGRPFFSSEFQLMSEAPYSRDEARRDFWKLQGNVLGSIA